MLQFCCKYTEKKEETPPWEWIFCGRVPIFCVQGNVDNESRRRTAAIWRQSFAYRLRCGWRVAHAWPCVRRRVAGVADGAFYTGLIINIYNNP